MGCFRYAYVYENMWFSFDGFVLPLLPGTPGKRTGQAGRRCPSEAVTQSRREAGPKRRTSGAKVKLNDGLLSSNLSEKCEFGGVAGGVIAAT